MLLRCSSCRLGVAAVVAFALAAAVEGKGGSPSSDGGGARNPGSDTRPSLLVVLSAATAKDNAWRSVAEGLRAKHSDMKAETLVCNGPVAPPRRGL